MTHRTLPWNQLGNDIVNATTIEDAMIQSGLNFEVVKNPIYDMYGHVIDNHFATTRTDSGDVLGVVGKNYQIVNNEEAFRFTEDLISEGVTFVRAGQFHHGKASWLLAKMPETKILGDEFDPYICFINSFDGTGAIKVAMTPIRIACSNALNFAIKNASRSWSTRHIGNIGVKLDEARYTLGLANRYMDALNVNANILAKKKMTDSEFEAIFRRVLPIDPTKDSTRKINNIEEIRNTMFDCLKAPDLANFTDTAWQKLNAVTDAIDHMAPARLTESFAENNWSKIAVGHRLVDAFYREIA